MRVYKISLQGLGYKAKSAVVVAADASETGIPFDILKGLPTIELVSVTLDVDSDENKWAKAAAWSLAFKQFQADAGINF